MYSNMQSISDTVNVLFLVSLVFTILNQNISFTALQLFLGILKN